MYLSGCCQSVGQTLFIEHLFKGLSALHLQHEGSLKHFKLMKKRIKSTIQFLFEE